MHNHRYTFSPLRTGWLLLLLALVWCIPQEVHAQSKNDSAAEVAAPADPDARVLPLEIGVSKSLRGDVADKTAVVLWDNGPLVNSPGTGAGGADESVLQNVSLGMGIFGFGHQVSAGIRIADDFTVTDPAGWVIDEIIFYAYQTGSTTASTITAVNYFIWDGPPGAGGAVIYGSPLNRLQGTGFSNIYRVLETTSGSTARPIMMQRAAGPAADAVVLPPGTYWIDWQTDGTLGSGPWAPPVTINGSTGTGNARQFFGGWGPATDVGPQDFPFILMGQGATTADLAVAKTVDDNTPNLGQTVTFTVTVTNVVGGNAPGVRIEDILPAGLAYTRNAMGNVVGINASQGTYNPDTGQWNVGTVAIGATETLTINATVQVTTPITNVAEITFSGIPDPVSGNNRATVTLNPQYADLSVRKSVTAFDVNNGVGTMVFHMQVFNAGPQTACGIVVEDRASAPMVGVSFVPSQGTWFGPNNPPMVTWTVGCLAPGASATATLTATAPDNPANLLVNVAEVMASSLPDPDSVPGDGVGDDYAATIAGFRADPDFVRGPGAGALTRDPSRFASDLVLTKTAADDSVPAGGSTTWTITVTNEGPQNNAGVMVQDVLPACLTATAVVPSAGTTFDAATGIWNVDKLKVGASATLAVTTTFGAGCSGNVTNMAEIIASNLPDPDSFFSLINPPTPDEKAEATVTVTEATAKAEVSDEAPARLLGNYPNPFNPETVIPFALREAGQVRLAVYDLLGRQVQLLVDGALVAGTHEVTFRASSLPTGVYLVRLEAAGQVQTQRITLMK